jgi:uncharacterized protein YkwD
MKRGVRRGLLLVVLLGALVAVPSAGAANYTHFLVSAKICPFQRSTSATVAQKRRAMICLVNHARKIKGLRPLKVNKKLNRAGGLKLGDNVRCDEFAHEACGKPFISVFKRSGYITKKTRSYAVGENLAWGQGLLGTPRLILLAWLRSDGHRHNLFSTQWRDMGIAYRFDKRFTGRSNVALWANEFGRKS